MTTRITFACVLTVLTAACTSSPTQPNSTAAGAPSIGAPLPVQPVNGALVAFSQPVTLVTKNAVVTGSGAPTYTFEVATDAAFTNKVQVMSSVAQGASGQTSVTLTTLGAATAYYWHVRAQGGGTTGVFSPAEPFTVGANISLAAPVPVAPLTGTTSRGWPTFTVTDSTRTGPAGPLVYRFDIGTSATFATIVLTATVPETPAQTSFAPPAGQAAPTQTGLFWRAIALDPTNLAASPASAPQSFTYSVPTSVAAVIAAQEGVALWPGVQPPGTNGQAMLGNNWQVQTLTSFDGVVFLSPTVEQLQVFDLLDRGLDPQSAINWMNGNGYPTTAAWYSSVAVIGFPYSYLALINGTWNIVIKSGA